MITGFISLCIASYFVNGCAHRGVRNLALKKSIEEDVAMAFVNDTKKKPLQIEEGVKYFYKICNIKYFEKCKSASSEFMSTLADSRRQGRYIVFKKDMIVMGSTTEVGKNHFVLTKSESEYQEYQKVYYSKVQKKWLFLPKGKGNTLRFYPKRKDGFDLYVYITNNDGEKLFKKILIIRKLESKDLGQLFE